MANFIGRKGSIGVQKEGTPGTEEAGSIIWFPKFSGLLAEDNQKAPMDAGLGSIHDIADHSLENEAGKLNAVVAAGATTMGHLLLPAFGQAALCKIITISGASGGTPAKDDAISSATGSWSGVIQKIFTIGATTYYAVSTTTGTIDAQTDVTNGTWTGGTSAVITGVNGHYFSVLNSNAHPTYTLYESNTIGDKNALYGALNTIDLNFVRGDYLKATLEYMAKKLNADSGLSPSFDSENYFKSRHFGVKIAANEAALNAADLVSAIESMSVTIAKNVESLPGSRTTTANNTSPAALVNTFFNAQGQIVLPYADDTYRDYFTGNTKKAIRQEWIDYDSSALSGAIYPQLIVDWYQANFEGFERNDDNNAIQKQTLNIVPEYDRTNGIRCDALLLNGQATAY
jgi:hypothetical protein